jgi:RsiW-degrading membrane proteinase PrsW (M82 family)
MTTTGVPRMADWFVHAAGAHTGPHPAEHVAHWVSTGQVPPDAAFWPDGGSDWLTLTQAWPLLTGVPGGLPDVPTAPLPPQGQPASPHGQPQAQPRTAGAPAPARNPVQAFTDRLADFAGVERLDGFRPRDLLSATFHRYSREELEQRFATGLPGYTPQLGEIESGWPKPWMFVRLFAGTGLLFVGFLFLTNAFGNANLLPGMILLGSFAVPLSTLVFFFELNTPRNVSVYLVVRCMLVGGLISLAVTLFFGPATSVLGPYVDPLLTGVVEEAAKLVAVFLVTLRLQPQRYPWILNGVLFGAAIGAGFACFESAGYAFHYLLTAPESPLTGQWFNVPAATHVIVVRGLLAPFGHVVWTALAAGALWRVKLDRPLAVRMLVHPRVLRMALVVTVLHAVWDFGFLDPPFLIKYLLLGVLAWVLAFGMLQAGLKQIRAAQLSAAAGDPQVSGATGVLRGVGG